MKMDSARNQRPLQAMAPCALEAFHQAGQGYLSSIRFRQSFVLGISEPERSLGAPFWLQRQEPENPAVQLRLLAFLRVYAAVMELGIDPAFAKFQMRNTPIRSFGHKTLFDVARDGSTPSDKLANQDSTK